MIIKCEVDNEIVKKACELVEMHYKDEEFLKVMDSTTFNMPGMKYSYVVKNSSIEISVKSYRTRNPFSSVVGYFDGKTIWVNTRKIDMPLEDRTANIWHELSHAMGWQHKGNRVTEFNLKTVPYLGSKLFVDYLKQKGVL